MSPSSAFGIGACLTPGALAPAAATQGLPEAGCCAPKGKLLASWFSTQNCAPVCVGLKGVALVYPGLGQAGSLLEGLEGKVHLWLCRREVKSKGVEDQGTGTFNTGRMGTRAEQTGRSFQAQVGEEV